MIKSIFFRFEINKKVGSGHAVRCLRIAKYLNEKKFNIFLLISTETIHNIQKNNLYLPKNFKIIEMNSRNLIDDAKRTVNLINKLNLNSKIYIFKDIYKYDVDWDNIVIKKYSNLIILDDFLDKKHNCKIYINFNPYNRNQILFKKKKSKISNWFKIFSLYSKKNYFQKKRVVSNLFWSF